MWQCSVISCNTGTALMGENGGALHVWRQRVHGKSLSYPLDLSVTLKLKNEVLKKVKEKANLSRGERSM